MPAPSKRQKTKCMQWCNPLVTSSHISGGTLNDELRLIEPTILGNVTDHMDIVQEEIFGPLTFIKPYNEVEEVIRYIRQRPNPLALYIFSEDKEFQQHVLTNTSSGGVIINDIVMHNVHPEIYEHFIALKQGASTIDMPIEVDKHVGKYELIYSKIQ